MKTTLTKWQIHNLLILSILSFFSCQDKENLTDPRLEEFLKNPDQDTIDILVLPEGETVTLNQEKIVVREFAEINGTLLVEPTNSGEFTIEVLDSDFTIAGEIRILDNNTGQNGRVNQSKANNGTSLVVGVYGQGANLKIKRNSRFASGDGQDAPDSFIKSGTSISVQGNEGGNGGDIKLKAPGGNIVFEKAEAGDTPLFKLGNGGKGGNIQVDHQLETQSRNSLTATGGDGGQGGRITLESNNILGILTPEELHNKNYRYIAEGSGLGGNGGHALWDNTTDGFSGQLPEILTTFDLPSIIMAGGDGGASIISGGTGGSGLYWCDRIINEIGKNITVVHGIGGKGGNIVYSIIPVYQAWGGDGGYAVVHGSHGWNGDKLIKSGANGGDIYFKTGKGGDVEKEVLSVISIGGNGGGNLTLKGTLPKETGIDDDVINSPAFWIITGRGGNGYSNCEGCPGGRGGDAGKIRRGETGQGGAVLNNPYDHNNSRTGDGGNIWSIHNGAPGDGGNGNPNGKAGCVPKHQLVLGSFGLGAVPIGQSGEELSKDVFQAFNEGDCGKEGELCGEELNCEITLLPKETGCWEKEGGIGNWYVEEIKYGPKGNPRSIWVETGVAVFKHGYYFTKTITEYDSEGNLTFNHTYDQEDNTSRLGGPGGGPYCQNGRFYGPGSNYTCIRKDTHGRITQTTKKLYGGCVPTMEELGYNAQEQQEFEIGCQDHHFHPCE